MMGTTAKDMCTGTIAERIKEVEDRMNAILHEYGTAADPPIFALRDEAMSLLRPRHLLRKMQISSRMVVVHPRNRYGDGLVPSHVHTLIDKFALHGFSLLEIGLPLCSEVPPKSHKRHDDVVSFNKKMVVDSFGQLAPIAEEEYYVMSVAKSHSSMASRCVILEVAHDNDKITDHGKLSLHRIEMLRPEYAAAIKSGFEWEVLCWQAEDTFPSMIDLLQDRSSLIT